jgi:hypothetical protein
MAGADDAGTALPGGRYLEAALRGMALPGRRYQGGAAGRRALPGVVTDGAEPPYPAAHAPGTDTGQGAPLP